MLWLKAFHVIAMVTWFAGLFYLPRLFVYHADAQDSIGGSDSIMERRLFALMTIGALRHRGVRRAHDVVRPTISPWAGCTRSCCSWFCSSSITGIATSSLRDFALDRNVRTAKWYRVFNEIPRCC